MRNIGQIMKKAQQAQTKMMEAQARLAEQEVTGQSGAGMVKVVMTGKGEMRSVKIDPSLVSPSDVEVLEDLVVAACNDARQKVDAEMQKAMSDATGGLGLPPGMKLPF
jgi:DNA-binding YbaB/EbfC family protein